MMRFISGSCSAPATRTSCPLFVLFTSEKRGKRSPLGGEERERRKRRREEAHDGPKGSLIVLDRQVAMARNGASRPKEWDGTGKPRCVLSQSLPQSGPP